MFPLGLGALSLVAGIPVAICIGIAAWIALAGTGANLLVIPQQFFSSLDNPNLLAIPFFMLTGALMDTGGIAKRLIDFAQAMVGHFKGGLGMVDVVASLFFADISGSATADTAAMGSIMIPGMVKKGYRPGFATALQSSAGSLGLLFPPSMSSIVYAYVANVSIGKMFLASFIPGFLVAASFMVVNYITAIREHYPREARFSIVRLWSTFRKALLALLTPVIILGGILGGVFTPTEAGVIASVYSFVIGAFIYKEIKLKDIPKILETAIMNSARVMFLVGMAFILGIFLTRANIPQDVAQYFGNISHNPLVIILIANVFLLVIHTVLETISSIIVVIPVLLPLVAAMHIDPLQFGIIVLVNSAIGINLPPVGFCLYTASAISGVKLEAAARAILPFIFVITLDLIIVILFPQLSLYLPSLSHL